MILLMLGNAITMLMKYKNITNYKNKSENLENISENANARQMVSSVEIALLTNEFAATINTNNSSNQMYNSNNKNNDSTRIDSRVRQLSEIDAVDENYTVAAFHGNHNNLLAPPTAAQRHNRFDDEINISNQRNEFSQRPQAAAGAMARQMEIAVGASKSSENAGGVVEHEAAWQEQQPQQQQASKELVLHRQKRYLIFPEGSSFQMVFDLIIGMVDYTNYLILGITCAVAWELPSKPPSELIEDLHEKVTEGIYPTSEQAAPAAMRRNDTSVDTNKVGDTKYGMAPAGIKYVDNANVAAFTGINYGGNMQQAQVVSTQSQRLPPPALSPLNAMEASYYTTARQSNPFASPITEFNVNHKESPVTHYYPGDGAYRPSNYYANTHSNRNYNINNNNKYYSPTYKHRLADKSEKSSYYGVSDSSSNSKNQKPFGYSAVGDSTDKQPVKFANLWQHQQQPQYKKWQSWQDYDSNWQPYQQRQQQKHAKWGQQQQKWATHSKFAGTDNWWQRNKQHVTNSWSAKPANWRDENVRIPEVPAQTREPIVAYAPPSERLRRTDTTINSKADAVEARSFDSAQRPILTTRPKAKIYPVFGRRRRRRRSSGSSSSNDAKLNAFELKLERIHLREQLRTRQKLFGKIEKLYETRGLNGSACVLRALCETGQQHIKQRQNDKAEPQSFITELLRAMFVLPTTDVSSSGGSVEFEEPALHPTDLHIVDRPYREAQAHRGNCAQLFAMCEHSIWD
ncbi:uncharacterized protein LOC118744771 [Rhagoletis pomonella]|uniref:uncharacterized protein LOC118744771 n=1 Tax=Rhagoletis pomonella TaxID=28610 RepID=UPI00178722CD|nr:uncharacterized protein LOC118744771 [Rhagoletis pomonella]